MDKNNRDMYTVVSNTDGIVFATQKEWHKLENDELSVLDGYAIITNRIAINSVYLLLCNITPFYWHIKREFMLVKITISGETGKAEFFYMELTKDEAELIQSTPLPLWE